MHELRHFFIKQLQTRLLQSASMAELSEVEAREAAQTLATESEKKEDARVMLEYGSLAKAHAARSLQARTQVQALESLLHGNLPSYSNRTPINLGAIVDVATQDSQGTLERTFILLPVGGAIELEGPGGDGFLSVLTPGSPVGRALLGKRTGDVIEVEVLEEVYEWKILEVS